MAISRASGSGEPAGQSAEAEAPPPPAALAWVGGWIAILALAFWSSGLAPWVLGVAAAGAALWSWGVLRRRERLGLTAATVLWLTVGLALGAQFRLWQVAERWPLLEQSIESRAAAALNEGLDGLVEEGEQAVEGVLAAVERGIAGVELFQEIQAVHARTGVSSIAVFGPEGTSVAWAGEHRGSVPLSVRIGGAAYVFHEGPLFSYVYFVRPLPDGGSVAAAALLDASLALGEGARPFAERFAARHGVRPRFVQPDRTQGETVWDWAIDHPILSVSFAALTQQHWWDRVVGQARSAVGALWLLSLILLSGCWYRGRMGTPGVPVLIGTLGLLVLPLGDLLGAEQLFSPLQFVLPGPYDVTLGMLLVLLVGSALWLLTRLDRPAGPAVVPWWGAAAASGAIFPLAALLISRSAASGLLASRPGGGFALLLATTLLGAIPLFVLLDAGRRGDQPPQRLRLPVLMGSAVLALLLALPVVLEWSPAVGTRLWAPALWAAPAGLAAWVLPRFPRRRRALRLWLISIWIAGTAAAGALWPLHLEAKLEHAERELARLGTEADPFLDFLLRQFADQASYLAAEGEDGVNLLYHSWVESGLAREGYEARLTLWEGGSPDAELRLSDLADPPEAMIPQLAAQLDPAAGAVVQRYTQLENLHYLLLVPLDEDRTVSVAVPPRRRLGRATALARFLHPESGPLLSSQVETLYLVPSPEGAPPDGEGSEPAGPLPVEWLRTPVGWRSEALARFPSGWMHAHLLVRTTTVALLAVRGVLVLAALLGIGALLWLSARILCGDGPGGALVGRRGLGTFRGRLTLALFIFFLLPTAVFGAVAYGAVAREVVRSAAGLARLSLEQAAPYTPNAPLAQLGSELGVDLLLYRRGTLIAAAAPEVLDLGLFHTWLPPEVYLRLAGGEELNELEERRVGTSNYLVAYRRLDPALVLAAPIPLAADEITRRQREFRDIALLMSVLGATLSIVLSLLVGRTLARPIDELSRAASTVGSGNLSVHLPAEREDEFGGVYRSFNQMVRRLRQARGALLRETRRTETIVSEAATGVLALDHRGRVELVNPRAAEVLGAEPAVGEPLPRSGPVLEALTEILHDFWRSGDLEAGRELDLEGRIVRIRVRRILSGETAQGAVVALEDVTSEVRTARVLAWGEMARQVAHEIKNPLTPIKLSVQHLRRAFEDGRSDFGLILDRNVDAILREIDRLGEIARAFARFGTPAEVTDRLAPIDVVQITEETLALYRSGGSGTEYKLLANDPARALGRTGELKEVLVNLLENAREAVNGGGSVEIRIERSEDGEWVDLAVADDGEGIPPELLQRIFEPHFSTRTSGTGLGLAIVQRMVESWGGEVGVESQLGVGTTIRLRLKSAAAEGDSDHPQPPPGTSKKSGTEI